LLSELALEVQPRSFASGYSPPTSGFGWNLGGRILADRINQRHKQLIQCVSGRVFIPRPFFIALNGEALSQLGRP
jgi:hypothetical protein